MWAEKRPHHVCPSCGYYNTKQVVEFKKAEIKRVIKMSNSIKIAIDVMGSDNGPEAIISGAALSKERNPETNSFFGDIN